MSVTPAEAATLQSRLWELPDRLGAWWPGLTSAAAAVTVIVYLFWLVKPMPVNALGGARIGVFLSCCMIATAALGNSGMMVWGQQIQQWALLVAAILQAVEWHRKPPGG
jgi:hypothetical protein